MSDLDDIRISLAGFHLSNKLTDPDHLLEMISGHFMRQVHPMQQSVTNQRILHAFVTNIMTPALKETILCPHKIVYSHAVAWPCMVHLFRLVGGSHFFLAVMACVTDMVPTGTGTPFRTLTC